MEITRTAVRNILTRTSGYLKTVTSHSLQPYRGCSFGNALCGIGCYVRHNPYVTRGRKWGSFLEVRENAAESYLANAPREAAWARRTRGEFSIFCSSSTDPFLPQERGFGITAAVLRGMLELPPDLLVLQTHSPSVVETLDCLKELHARCRLRVQMSIESDLDRLPGLPPPAAGVEARFDACGMMKAAGIPVVVTVSPLHPLWEPLTFFQRIAAVADAVVLDHFIGGDGSSDGRRTRQTALPEAIRRINPEALTLAYRDEMAALAERVLPGRVGVGIDGFAGRYGRHGLPPGGVDLAPEPR